MNSYKNNFNSEENKREYNAVENTITNDFCGILNGNEAIKKDFIENILELPSGNYKIFDQETIYNTPERRINSKIKPDMIVISDDVCCYVENKVDAKENAGQLNKYIKSLYKENELYTQKTYLRYCTKNEDKKDIDDHNFKQYRWQDVAKLMNKYCNIKGVYEFINILKYNGINVPESQLISKNNKISTSINTDIILQKLLPKFNAIFPKLNTKKYIREGIFYAYKYDIIAGEYLSSYIVFGIKQNEFFVKIMIKKSNANYEKIKNLVKDFREFKLIENELCIFIVLSKKWNTKMRNKKILKWFNYAFKKLKKIIAKTTELKWKTN
jgi:hypothetical protein